MYSIWVGYINFVSLTTWKVHTKSSLNNQEWVYCYHYIMMSWHDGITFLHVIMLQHCYLTLWHHNLVMSLPYNMIWSWDVFTVQFDNIMLWYHYFMIIMTSVHCDVIISWCYVITLWCYDIMLCNYGMLMYLYCVMMSLCYANIIITYC